MRRRSGRASAEPALRVRWRQLGPAFAAALGGPLLGPPVGVPQTHGDPRLGDVLSLFAMEMTRIRLQDAA